MTIGNILSQTGNSSAKMSVLLVALLPVPPRFTGELAWADQTQLQINADSLRAVFNLVLAPLHYVSHEGIVMDYPDSKTHLCLPILSAWIADHAEHTTLHGICSKSFTEYKFPSSEVGGNLREVYEVHHYPIYEEKARQLESGQAASTQKYFWQVGVKIGCNVFAGQHQVNLSDLHKPDFLHNIYLGIFKHLMQWVEGFLKKHKRQQAFNDAWKQIPPYPGFSVPIKAYQEVTQWQEKEMRNLSKCISAILASVLRNPSSSQNHDFQNALKCVNVNHREVSQHLEVSHMATMTTTTKKCNNSTNS